MSPPPPPLIFGINTAHAQTNTAPTIALAADTGSSPSDGITNNGVVNVTGLADGATWKYVTDGGSTFTAGSGSSFTLPEGVYDANDVQVVQTVSGTDSAPALLGAVTVDTTGPELVRHNDKFADGEINTEQTHTFIFSEPVTGLEVGDFTGASVTVNRVIDSGDHITYTLYFTPSPRAAVIGGNLLLARNAVTDLAGNMGPSDRADVSALNTGGGSNTVVAADTTAPTVDFGTIDVGVIGTRQTHTIRFNQIVTGFAATDITATGATVNSLSGSGSTYTITFTPTLTSFTLTLAADSVSDTAATPNTGPAAEPAAARSVSGTAVLSADADLATLSITDNNGNPVTPNEAIAPDTLTYTATAPSDTTSVTITVTAADSNAEVDLDSLGTNTENFGFRDAMQSFAIEITAADGTTMKLYRLTITRAVSLDTTAPSATFGTIDVGVIGTQQTVGLTFDEAVTGLEASDFSGSTEVTVDSVTGSGDTWSITYTPTAAAFTLTLAANSVEDTAATPNTGPAAAATATGSAVDTTAPTVDWGTIAAGVIGTAQTHALTFSEAVTGLAATDITATGATVDSVRGSGSTYSITFTPSETSFTLTLAADSVMDTAATPNTGPETAASVTGTATPATVPDMTAPTATFGTIDVGVIGTAQTHDITFSEAVTGLAADDFSASTGVTGTSVSGSGSTYSITFTPSETSFTLRLAADSVTDRAGNTGPASAVTATGTAVDATAPEITLIGASPLEVEHGSTFTDPGATASDGVDGALSASIVVGGDTVDTATPGDYTITYDVSDAADNAAETVTRIVRVVIVRDLAKLNAVILPEVARSMADQHVSAIVRRLEQARRSNIAGTAASSSFGGAGNLTELIKAQGRALVYDRFDWKRVLAGSAFVLPLNVAGSESQSQGFTLWGAGDYRSIEGADGVRWDGDLFSLQLGLDAQLNARTILGVSVSKSQARLDYTDPSLAVSGDYDLDMTSVHPYLGWVAGGLDFWATAGYGDGELEISEDRAPGEAIPTSDLSMQTLALGASGILMETGRTSLRLKGEAMSSSVELDGNEQITAVTRDASRLRMTLEATRAQALDSGAQFESSLEAGLRYDGGDGETGAGAELGASLRYASLGGIVIEGKARALVGGEAEEWGLSGAISFQPSTNGRGLSFSLTPGYGVTTGGVQQLWQQGLDDGLGGASHGASNEYSPSLKVRLDYGMHALRGPGLMTPYTELSLGDKNTYRLGLHWQRNKLFDLKLVTERKEGTTTADHRIYLEGELAF